MTYGYVPDDDLDPPHPRADESPPEDESAPQDVPARAPIPAVSFAAPRTRSHSDTTTAELPPWVLPLVSQLVDVLRLPPSPTDGGEDPPLPPPPPEPRYSTVENWVSDWLAPMIVRRHGPEFRWCPQWWQHAEAISRLTGLWSTWETAYADSDAAMLSWYRDCLDHHLPVLCSGSGPFLNCSNDQGHNRSPGIVLQTIPTPDNFWGTASE